MKPKWSNDFSSTIAQQSGSPAVRLQREIEGIESRSFEYQRSLHARYQVVNKKINFF